jgi:hypothetical protein
MGILDKNGWDIFCSYARLDNDLHHNWIRNFASDLKRRVQVLLSDNGYKFDLDEIGFFFDTEGMPANGPLAPQLIEKIKVSHFLFLFVGRNYLRSHWCGDELTWFSQRFSNLREAALKNVFVIILTPEALRDSTNPRLQQIKHEGIFQLAFAPDGKEPISSQLADAQNILRANPDYVRLVDKLATTLASRFIEILRSPPGETRTASPAPIVGSPAETTDQSRPLTLPPSEAPKQKTVGPTPVHRATWITAVSEIVGQLSIPLVVAITLGLVLVSVMRAPSTPGVSIGIVMGLFAAGLSALLVYWALFSGPKKTDAAIVTLIAAAFLTLSATILGVPWGTTLVVHPQDQDSFFNSYFASYTGAFIFGVIFAAKQLPLSFGRMMASR